MTTGQKNNTMKIITRFFFLLALLLAGPIMAQRQTYTVTKSPFSTDSFDEFAPVFYKNGLVFCANKGQSVSNRQGKGMIKMYYADTASNGGSARLFSKAVSYTHLRAHETRHDLVCRLLL